MMRLVYALVAAAVLWGGYWFYGAATRDAAFEAWFQAQQADGWVAEAGEISTRGFPNRLDTSVADLELADTGAGLAYRTSLLQIFSLSYRQNHVILVWPAPQQIATPFGKTDIQAEDMRASIVFDDGAAKSLTRSNLVATDLRAITDGALSFEAKQISAAIDAVEKEPATYHMGVHAQDIIVPRPQNLRLATPQFLPDRIDHIRGDVTVVFDADLQLAKTLENRPSPREIKVKLIEARWGQLDVKLAGRVTLDDLGRMTGRMTVKAENWQEILALGAGTGVIPEPLAHSLEQGFKLLSGLSGNPQTLDLPLDIKAGQMRLGPVPLGAAPILRLR